jgi:very-short-patch-repair endonuclease
MSDARMTTDETQIFKAAFAEWAQESEPYHAYLYALKFCESPIEKALVAALVCKSFEHCGTAARATPRIWSPAVGVERAVEILKSVAIDFSVWLMPQAQIGPYRVDFLLLCKLDMSDHIYRFVVECDGHDFHQATKEQVRRDKVRDRYLAREGYTVLRFTGSEIFNDAIRCASEVRDTIEAAVWDRDDKAAA